MSSKTSVTIGTISAGAPRLPFVRSLLNSQEAGHSILIRDSHAYLDMARNEVVAEHLRKTTNDWLLMVDDDIGYSEDDVKFVTSHDHTKYPIVTGLYANNFPEVGIVPLCYDYRYDPEAQARKHCIMSNAQFWNLPRVDDSTLVEIDGCGAGFLAIHRSVLTAMYEQYGPHQPWFAELVLTSVWTGEDLMFCLRAKTMGYSIMADIRTNLTHDKRCQYSVWKPEGI